MISRRSFLKMLGIGLIGISVSGCTLFKRWFRNPLQNLPSPIKDLLAKEVEVKYSKKLRKIVDQTQGLRQKLYPKQEPDPIIEKYASFFQFLDQPAISEQQLYQDLDQSIDLLILGWSHNFGDNTAPEVAQSISTYLNSGRELNFFLFEGMTRGAKLVQDFNQGEINSSQLAKAGRSRVVWGVQSPYGEEQWQEPIYRTLREKNIELIGLEKKQDISGIKRMELIPEWIKEVAEQKGTGALLIGRSHLNNYLFLRSTFLLRLVGFKQEFLRKVEKLGDRAFLSTLPLKTLILDLYSQVDYALTWDVLCGVILLTTIEKDRPAQFEDLTKRWRKEVKRMEQEKVFKTGNTYEKVFPDHYPPVVTPPDPYYLNSTYLYLTLYPEQLTRNLALSPQQYMQGDFSQFSLRVGEDLIKIMELDKGGKITKIILPEEG